ncbi:MAG TPA: protease modulator HflK [Verrucomicrobiota bacterium]|nr:protease modulator HflK [Verrucomicrobiota bacterium]
MSEHDPHDHHDHPHPPAAKPAAKDSEVQDVGSRALAEALGSSFFFVKLVMLVLIIVFFASGVVRVQPGERAVILRFGKPTGKGDAQLLEPGLHFAWPPPIDEVVRIPIGQIQSVTSGVGWYATTPEMEVAGTEPPPMPSLNPAIDGYTLTSDGNIVHARATMGYRVTDALAYVFAFTSASNVVQAALDNALVWASSQMTVDEALKNNDAFKEKVVRRVTQLSDRLDLGITLDTMNVRIVPPRYVKEAFDAVTGAEADKNKVVLAAQGEADALLASSRAEANAIVNSGKTASSRYLKNIMADATAFREQLPEYKKNPELFQQRLLTERWQRVLANADEKNIILDRADGQPRELRILLKREPERPRTNSPAQR